MEIYKTANTGIPKRITLYEYPVRSKEDLKGNHKLQVMDIFVDPGCLPPKKGGAIEVMLGSSVSYAGGNLTLIITEVCELENSVAISGYNIATMTEFYLNIEDRKAN